MKQVLQNLSNGTTDVVDVPCPAKKDGYALITTSKTLVSIGTERMLVDFGKANLIDKVKMQPDKVKMVVDKVKNDGFESAYEAVRSKLDEPIKLGYCNVGKILDGSSINLKDGTRVVSNGPHAEVVRVPKNLIAEIPENVDDETAAFTVVGAIALQGIRLLNPTIGETVCVVGLGLIGLLTVQILKAAGCKVIGIDTDPDRCKLAKNFGAVIVNVSKGEDPVSVAMSESNFQGVDGVIITASSKSHDIVHQAALMSRKKGRIILVGVIGLNLRREDFYEKELTFQVSCSYGPGRYDDNYELKGNDYPYAYVRWTEQRNFEAVLELMSTGKINTKSLVTHKYSFDKVKDAYESINDNRALGILLNFNPDEESIVQQKTTISIDNNHKTSEGSISFIGGGNYASRVLIPAFVKNNAKLVTLVTDTGVSAATVGKKFNFLNASTNINDAFTDTDAVIIATQHSKHAEQIIAALEKKKHVFVEKPLALSHEDIDKIEQAQKISKTIVMVGFNRRFSPHVQKMKSLIEKTNEPKTFIMTMNAGKIDPSHWIQDISTGGGRIAGEACHYIDLMRYLADSKIKGFNTATMGKNNNHEITEDKSIINLEFENGSIGSINYFANGGKSFPKERIEVFCNDAVLQIDNFRSLKSYGWPGFRKMSAWKQDKGQNNCVKQFMHVLKNNGISPIPQQEIFEVARITLDIVEHIRSQNE
tara:strand:+ start:2765 stop:4879 length:2115 start_codon:yes stop_codon:yes gene_type:complete